MTALARRLPSRGHAITFMSVLDAGPIVRAANLDFLPIGETEYPLGSMTKPMDDFSQLRGLDGIKYWHQNFLPGFCEAGLKYLPEIVRQTGIEALAFDTAYRHLELVPMQMGIPYADIWNVLPLDATGATPPFSHELPYDPTPKGRARNLEALGSFRAVSAPSRNIAISHAEKLGLQINWKDRAATISKLAILSQTPKEFDLPGIDWPAQFHYTGPFHDDTGREPVPFAWENLTGEPLIYASLGTFVNGLEHVYRAILEAVGKISEVQMVLSIGRRVNPEHLGPIPSNTLVVSQAPQLELLKRAELCITHAGLNTTLESLTCGVPMVAIPIAFDQPGVAVRIGYHKVGEYLSLDNLNSDRLLALIQTVRNNPDYKAKALYFQKVIEKTRGLDLAVDLLEQAFGKALSK